MSLWTWTCLGLVAGFLIVTGQWGLFFGLLAFTLAILTMAGIVWLVGASSGSPKRGLELALAQCDRDLLAYPGSRMYLRRKAHLLNCMTESNK